MKLLKHQYAISSIFTKCANILPNTQCFHDVWKGRRLVVHCSKVILQRCCESRHVIVMSLYNWFPVHFLKTDVIVEAPSKFVEFELFEKHIAG